MVGQRSWRIVLVKVDYIEVRRYKNKENIFCNDRKFDMVAVMDASDFYKIEFSNGRHSRNYLLSFQSLDLELQSLFMDLRVNERKFIFQNGKVSRY